MILRHIGITVTDLEKSLEFYRDILGFQVVRIMDESGAHIDKFSALEGVKVKTVKLDRVLEKGYTINSPPQYSPDGKVKLTFCSGPDGTLIEMVEELN